MSVDHEVAVLTVSNSQLALNLKIIVVIGFQTSFIIFKAQKREKFAWLDLHVSPKIGTLDLNNAVRIDQAIRGCCEKGIPWVNEKATVHDI